MIRRMHAYRARLSSGILIEFMPPAVKRKKTRVIIIAKGMPAGPSAGSAVEYFSKKGFWVITFRYRGSWESEGTFLRYSPDTDIISIIDALPRGLKELWGGKKFTIAPDEIFVAGISFGGAAALLASSDERINKVVVFSPVVDWTVKSKTEPISQMKRFLREAFGPAYRTTKNAWEKIQSGVFYNPMHRSEAIDGSKILIIHARDDEVTPIAPVRKFAKKTGAKFIEVPTGGHFGSRDVTSPRWWSHISKHFRS